MLLQGGRGCRMAALNPFLPEWLGTQGGAAVVTGVRLGATSGFLASASTSFVVIMRLLRSLMAPLAQLLLVPFKVTVCIPLRIWPRSFQIVGRCGSALRLHPLRYILTVDLVLRISEDERLVLEIGARRLRPLGHNWRPAVPAILLLHREHGMMLQILVLLPLHPS